MAQPAEQVPAERPAPPGDELEAPEVTFEPPDKREIPDGEAVSRQGGLVEPPD